MSKKSYPLHLVLIKHIQVLGRSSEALAGAFHVRPEALRIYDISAVPANGLFQLGETYGLKPRSDERFAVLEPTN